MCLDGGAKTKSTYLEFEVNGEGRTALAFDVRGGLAPAPSAFARRAKFHIINKKFDNLHITASRGYGQDSDGVDVPGGQMIGVATRLRWRCPSSNKKPLSSTAAVDFLDEDGGWFSCPPPASRITARTLEPFVEANTDAVDDRLRPRMATRRGPSSSLVIREGEPEYRRHRERSTRAWTAPTSRVGSTPPPPRDPWTWMT